MTVQCCKCKRVRVENEWTRPLSAPPDAVSHTYCPVCFEEARTEMLADVAQYKARALRVPVSSY
jgi:hypothetical protein